MATVTTSRRTPATYAGVPWGLYLFIGALWLILGWIVLRFDTTSVTTISLLAGLVILGAAVFELFDAIAAPGWRWLHVLLGLIFAAFGIVVLVDPGRSFVWIAAFVAFYLLFAGFFNIIMAFATSQENDAWWLLLIVGIVQMVAGFWAGGSWARSSALLILLVGALAIFRGVTEIVTGFHLRRLQQMRETPPGRPVEPAVAGAGLRGRDMVNPPTTGRGGYEDTKPRNERWDEAESTRRSDAEHGGEG